MSYSWGDDSSTSYGGGGGYDYSPARRTYDPGKAYVKKKKNTKKKSKSPFGFNPNNYPDVMPKVICRSENPLVLAMDITGSMGSWPTTLADKIPMLYAELLGYIPDVEISVAAIGDADGGGIRHDYWSYTRTTITGPDDHPLQVRDFDQGPGIEEKLKSITRKAGGGNNGYESFELAAFYYARQCEMPNAVGKPLMFFTGDDKFCDMVTQKNVRKVIDPAYTGVSMSSIEVFRELSSKFDVYFIQRDRGFKRDKEITYQWQSVLGPERVMLLKQPERFVDCILGIAADHAGQSNDFSIRLSQRQTPNQVSQVVGTLNSVGLYKKNNGGIGK